MELQRYFRILGHHRLLVILEPVLVVLAVAFFTSRMTPIYSASALLRVAQPTSDVVSSLDLDYTQRLIQTYVQVLKSRPFLEEASQRLGLDISPGDLAKLVGVQAVAGTELIRITVNSNNPELAEAIANTLAALLIEQGQKVYTGEGNDAQQILLDQLHAVEAQLAEDRARLAMVQVTTPERAEASSLGAKIRAEEATYSMLLSQYERARLEAVLRANSITVIEPAVIPIEPTKPNMMMNLALGAVIGICGGLGLAFLFEALAPAVHSDDTSAVLRELELIGKIPKWRQPDNVRIGGRMTRRLDLSPHAVEPFLALGATITSRYPSQHSLVVSSAEPRVGKSTISAYLGIALAQLGHRVIIVDGDQRLPIQHELFDLPMAPGLVDLLVDPQPLSRCLISTRVPGLRVLPAGSRNGDQLAFWHGAKLPELIKKLLSESDVVIWDTPPILAAVDAKLLAPFADLFLLVVAEDRTTRKELEQALEQLRQTGCVAPGIVYNKTKEKGYATYEYYYRAHFEQRLDEDAGDPGRIETPSPIGREV